MEKEFKKACDLLREVYNHGEAPPLHETIRKFLVNHKFEENELGLLNPSKE